MKWFLNLPIRWKLITGFGAMVLLLAVVVLTAYRTTAAIRDSQSALYREEFLAATELAVIRSHMNRNRAEMLQALSDPDPSRREVALREVAQVNAKMDTRLQSVMKSKALSKTQMAKLREFVVTMDAYRKTQAQQMALMRQGSMDAARQLSFGIQTERYNEMRTATLDLGDEVERQAEEHIAESELQAARSITTCGVVGAAALLVGVLMVLLLNWAIAAPLRTVVEIADRLAAGDLTVKMAATERRDEAGALMAASGRMVKSLWNQTRQVQEAMDVLASSASEILAASSQLAAGATETATAVSQTTTTVEEVRQTAQVSTDKARMVSESAQQTQQVSDRGRGAAQETLERMNGIRAQVESIGDTVVRLSEQSQAIGQIITVVDDLAEQSNLLAVNAAIEAAKAGEQGRGFAVVAQEIRSLAEQSKGATTQVRAILNDIQKATSAAVMATEQGSKAVESGMQQAADSGEAIRALAESVREAAQAAVQIAASSQQQMVGVEQVALAMENIKQASGQNAASAGQLEAEARGLHELGATLKELVERYRL